MKYTILALIPAAYSLPVSQFNRDISDSKSNKINSPPISQQSNGDTGISDRFWYGYPVKGYDYYFNDPNNIYPYYGYVYEAIRRQLETNPYSAVNDSYMRQISTATLPVYSVNDANALTPPPPAYSPEFVIQQGHNRLSAQSAQNGGERGFMALNVNQ
ncbi:hypothetical protein CONCODRAFT_12537 [Conidiobolus coronatus NRRL 28638]|uniref:Uncharacterized protein n=1 Tax=Conidiobolus coronatus (strain ATCC 28846 / CBS 209.66 / NRRL 28638) TaxID=796925 RepID=A0A137NSS8_CONC2|nr:hypothetical protein CONCODRAFT_12537 [Conidiobolus coronatus NRRL 28638]|eukprot:KXN65781.1 hypothetical protein CONCODRAFT_12537 [Conidiobolus coronatus NRRL 28638]